MIKNQARSYVKENYLKALHHLTQDKESVSVNELANHLRLKMPTVTNMMQKLADDKLVRYEKYKPIILTAKGKKRAGLIVRKHRLTEMFLVEKMHLGWEEVHDIAEQIEHIESPLFFQKMDELLGYPSKDPHGSPIPDADGKIKPLDRSALSDALPGQHVKLTGIGESSDDLLKFLNDRKIKLGIKIKVLKKESFDGSMLLSISGREMTFSKQVCRQLLVEAEK